MLKDLYMSYYILLLKITDFVVDATHLSGKKFTLRFQFLLELFFLSQIDNFTRYFSGEDWHIRIGIPIWFKKKSNWTRSGIN